jgi:hypothetical protein
MDTMRRVRTVYSAIAPAAGPNSIQESHVAQQSRVEDRDQEETCVQQYSESQTCQLRGCRTLAAYHKEVSIKEPSYHFIYKQEGASCQKLS